MIKFKFWILTAITFKKIIINFFLSICSFTLYLNSFTVFTFIQLALFINTCLFCLCCNRIKLRLEIFNSKEFRTLIVACCLIIKFWRKVREIKYLTTLMSDSSAIISIELKSVVFHFFITRFFKKFVNFIHKASNIVGVDWKQ